MSKYTTELRYIVESGFNLGLNDYPIFNENHRLTLNQKIIDHYYFREIGMETAGAFKFALNRKMREIMPKYNALYYSESLKFDPLQGVNIEEIYSDNLIETNKSKTDGVTELKTSADNEHLNNGQELFNNTPQGLLEDGSIENKKYLTDATLTKDEGKQHGTSNSTGTTGANAEGVTNKSFNFSKKRKGSEYHNPSELLLKYRETIINIDMLIINELADLFINIF